MAASKHDSVHVGHTHLTIGVVTEGTTLPESLRRTADSRQGLNSADRDWVFAVQKPTLNLRKWSAKLCTLM